MEPETTAPQLGPEQTPREYGPERVLPPTPERGLLETGAERTEQIAETAARASDTAMPAGVAPTTVVNDNVATDDAAGLVTPVTASDDDLIEKEWVDRAKKLVSDTIQDPYKQENAVVQLQKDYQKKRFGRELGEAS
jgi:hypothetical protein